MATIHYYCEICGIQVYKDGRPYKHGGKFRTYCFDCSCEALVKGVDKFGRIKSAYQTAPSPTKIHQGHKTQ